MIEYLKCIFFNILIIIFINPHLQAQEKIKTFDLTKTTKPSNIRLSDLGFVEVDYIPLETKEQSLISNINLTSFNDFSINKIIPGDGYFIIKNRDKVLKFREDGTFIANIGKVGRGPGEINQIEDLDIDKENHNIYMVSGWQKKFYVYSPHGEFIKTFEIPFYIREFRFFENKILCYCGNNRGDNNTSFILIDKLGHLLKSFPNKYQFKSKSVYWFTHENLFYVFNKKIFIKELCSDAVYSFENIDFKPHLVIDVGKKQVTPNVRSECDMLEINANYIQPRNLLEFGNFVYYAYVDKWVQGDVRIYGFVGSKKDNYQALFNLGEGIINDLDGGPNILPLTAKDDYTIISMIDPLTLKKHIASEVFKKSAPKYPDKKKELEKLGSRISEMDNPILVLVKIK